MSLETVVVIIGIASPLVGWGVLIYQNGKSRGTTDTDVKADIKGIKEDISNINKTLGNGGYGGIKGTIHSMQINCAAEMTALKKDVSNLLKRGGPDG